MLSLDHISMQFGGRVLFDDFSFVLGPHDRIGLVGSNGTGKSTLLKIIAGLIEPEGGTIAKARYVTVGYLPQDSIVASERTLYDEASTAFDDVLDVQSKLEETHQQLSILDPESTGHREMLEIYGELQHKLEGLDAFRMKSKIEQVLMGLGFSVRDFQRSTGEFSGGWQMRIALAKLLLREPSILLLDEPTNHLDLDSLRWLENYLRNYNGAVVLVSHDRAFLDNLTHATLALSHATIEPYQGNYSFYEQERLVRREQALNALKNREKKVKQTQEFIDRFRYKATKARQVQSRIKQLEKLDKIDLPEEEEEIRFHFPQPNPGGVIAAELKNIVKRYGPISIFNGLSITIERGDRIAVVGINGAGKSTFARILAGVEPFESGERTPGYNTVTAYFAQHQADELDLTKEVLQTIDEIAPGEIRLKLRTLLGSFLFHGDDVFKKVAVLSGGEKSRLALAKMLLQPANFLIMDEPTNHLDMRSKQVLQEALAEYEGTYLIVAHDRAFLDPIVTKVLEFSPGKVRTFPGNISEYVEKKSAEKNIEAERQIVQQHSGQSSPTTEKDRKRFEAERRQEISRKSRPIKEQLEKIERDIVIMERRKKEIESLMGDPDFYKNGEEAKKAALEYQSLQPRLEQSYASWTEITEKIEKLKQSN
jgi:ATP-binding cassette subfamily F protein 3